jgi:group I intron endonuclease
MNVIYKITCVKNNKFYIGSSTNKTQRWAKHRRELRTGKHINKHMQASWNTHGEDSFLFEVIEEVATPEALFAAEQRYLDEHTGQEYCFNWARYAGAPMRGKKGAETPNYGKTVSEHIKQHLREANSGPNNPCWGVPVPEERKAKIRASNLRHPHKNRKHTPEAIAKIAAASRGRPCSEETRRKRSIASKGREVSLDQRLRISRTLSGEGNFWYGKKRPDSFKEKIRKPVIATNPGGIDMVFESIQTLREKLNMTATTVNRALKSGKPIAGGPKQGWSFRYKDVDHSPIP